MKLLSAVDEERRAAFLQVELPRVELDESLDQCRRRTSLTRGEPLHRVNELIVG